MVVTEVLQRCKKEIWICLSSVRIQGLSVFWKLKLEMDLIKANLYVAACHMILCHITTFRVRKEQCKINLQRRRMLIRVTQFLHKSQREFIAIYVVNITI